MKIHAAFLLAVSLLPLAAPPPARAGDAGVVVTATVRPKRVTLSDIKTSAPINERVFDVTVTYTITNRTAETQVVNGFCTHRAGFAGDDGKPIILKDRGSDATRRMDASDILIIKPGGRQTFHLEVRVFKEDTGIMLAYYEESGEFWCSAPIAAPKFVDITAVYVNPLTGADIEKMRPELKGAKYSLAELKLPAVRLEIAR